MLHLKNITLLAKSTVSIPLADSPIEKPVYLVYRTKWDTIYRAPASIRIDKWRGGLLYVSLPTPSFYLLLALLENNLYYVIKNKTVNVTFPHKKSSFIPVSCGLTTE